MAQGEQINPRMLLWGRETAGLSIEEAAEKLGLKDTVRRRAVDKLRALEAGERAPSRTQLGRAAVAYHRPLIAFYLPVVGAAHRRLHRRYSAVGQQRHYSVERA